ncbi:MAG TPA: UvrD-helicase domain-containing protein [Candidatus Limnocylindrales bacterium]|nr:UvrD-helicase domain-containing protein [Candidatus Limnocylindrales bacterium]
MSPTQPGEPAKRRRRRLEEPDGQGTWLDPGDAPVPARDRAPGAGDARLANADAGAGARAVPEEPEWMRDAPPDPELEAGPALSPEEAARALQERRAARAIEITSRLNPEQGRAVTTTDGPLLILAGAGSGKTRVVAHRIAYLIGVKAVAPRRILAVTFTNRAAGELRERIRALVGEHGQQVDAGTFHALCARVLRQDGDAIGLDRRFVIYDTDDQQQLMKRILAEQDLPATGEYRPAAILGAISRAKNEMLDADFLAQNAVNHKERVIAKLAARYEERLRQVGAVDFDDLLLKAVELFDKAPEALAKYQKRWLYLHVDEYQDTNRPQYLWVKALAAAHRNLCVVGDDDQSIYGWRGANVQNILDFERDYPDATVVKLEQNYRSTQLILDAAHAVVSRNERRTDKKLWTENQGGVPIQRFEAFNEEEEAEWIARQVEGLVGSTGKTGWLTRRADDDETTRFRPKDLAVMYRMNSQSRAIEEAFLRYGIRYQLVGGTRFYQRREVKDALAYLRVLRSDTDAVSYERVINVPARGIGDKSLGALRAFAARNDDSMILAIEAAGKGEVEGLTGRARTAIGEFYAVVARLRRRIGVLPLPELLDEVLEQSGYRAMLADGSEEGEDRWANLLELRAVTTRYDDLSPEDALDRLLEETALVADQDSYEGEKDAVTLITLHAAKGLEFPVVFIAGLEEGVFPHNRALDDERELEEERRLAYVGITRAKRRLFLSHAWRRATWGGGGMSIPSRFLMEIPPDLMVGPQLRGGDLGADLDPDVVFRERGSRLGAGIRAGGGAYRQGSGRPGAPAAGEPFRPTRDLGAKRDAFAAGAPSGSLGRLGGGLGREPSIDPTGRDVPPWDEDAANVLGSGGARGDHRGGPGPRERGVVPPRPIVPGERRYRDGDRVRHARWGDGIVITSKLTRDDEEVQVAFRDPQVGRKTMLASLANLELLG